MLMTNSMRHGVEQQVAHVDLVGEEQRAVVHARDADSRAQEDDGAAEGHALQRHVRQLQLDLSLVGPQSDSVHRQQTHSLPGASVTTGWQ